MARPGFNNPVFQPQGAYGTSLQPPAQAGYGQQPGQFPQQAQGQQAYPGYAQPGMTPAQQACMEAHMPRPRPTPSTRAA